MPVLSAEDGSFWGYQPQHCKCNSYVNNNHQCNLNKSSTSSIDIDFSYGQNKSSNVIKLSMMNYSFIHAH